MTSEEVTELEELRDKAIEIRKAATATILEINHLFGKDLDYVYLEMLKIRRGDYIPNNLCGKYGITLEESEKLMKRLVKNGEAGVFECGDLIRLIPNNKKHLG